MGQALLKPFSCSKNVDKCSKVDSCAEGRRPCSDLPELTVRASEQGPSLSLATGQALPKPFFSSKNEDNCGKVDSCGARQRPCSDLPDLALHAIVMKLSSPFTLCAFAGVCRSWRSVAKSCRSDFIASQPPLLLILPPARPDPYKNRKNKKKKPSLSSSPSSSSSPFRFYSVIENRIYSVAPDQFPPILASAVLSEDLSIVGLSYGYLVASSEYDKRRPISGYIPMLVDLCTGKTVSFPKCSFRPVRGLLTCPPKSGNSMLILYTVYDYFMLIFCCRLGDSSGSVYKFELPRASRRASSIRSTVVHGDKLYLSILRGKVMVADISGIQAAATMNILATGHDRGIVMISSDGSPSKAGDCNVFVDGRLQGAGGYLSDDSYVPCTSTYHLSWIDVEEDNFISSVQSAFCAAGDGVWIHPSDFNHLGFKNIV